MVRRGPIAGEEQAYEVAVSLLARKARTSAEMVDSLSAKGVDDATIQSVLGRLKSHRHLDDAALASDQAFSLIEGKGLSPAAAVQTLVARGIPEATAREGVEAAREGRTELDLARQALDRRLKGRTLSPEAAAREARALARAGYEEDVVERTIERALRTE